ncbi:SDR family oxidoreductase [Nucisporomicrobium flavum]|uniref:SDR family oxidoreductase n=1 Tax=Nucisporomicrobium flavum TaxID=2785915 RepID=UPI0018F4EBB1|nr:SDR family oxidoreductase [Nucisporomicrobium flavum]
MEMQNQRVVVLGGTSGIGAAVAQGAAGRGADVVVVSSSKTKVDAAVGRLPGASGAAVDLTDPAATEAFFAAVGDFDHLVYTAGEPLSLMPVAAFDAARARAFFELRYFSLLGAVHRAVPRIRPGGSITLTSGTAADRPGPGWLLGASICGAMDSLTRALATELAPIRVNAVKPGVTRSPLWDRMDDPAELYAQAGAGLPLGRVGEVEEVAAAYLYLLTQPYSTGTVLTADGGTLVA